MTGDDVKLVEEPKLTPLGKRIKEQLDDEIMGIDIDPEKFDFKFHVIKEGMVGQAEYVHKKSGGKLVSTSIFYDDKSFEILQRDSFTIEWG